MYITKATEIPQADPQPSPACGGFAAIAGTAGVLTWVA